MATSIRLQPDIEKRLDHLAESTGRTKAFYLRQIIENGLGEMEDYYLAAEVTTRIRQGKEETHSAGSMRAKIDLDDGYRAMANDAEREAEAVEWCNALSGDMSDATR